MSSSLKMPTIVTGLFCFVVFLCAHVRAQGDSIPEIRPSQLGVEVTQWTVEDGLPIQIITSLAQTPDGFIWCGSFAGLIRFDGIRFRVFDNERFPGLDGVLILKIFVDGEGALWLIGQAGELGRFDGDRVTRFEQTEDFPDGGVSKGAVDESGRLWVRCTKDHPFLRHDGGGEWTPVLFQGVNAAQVDTFSPVGDEASWVILRQGRTLKRVSLSADPEPAEVEMEGPAPHFGRFFRFPDGGLGVTSTRGNFREENGTWRPVFPIALEAGLQSGATNDGAATTNGTHWMADYNTGLIAFSASGRSGRLQLGLQGENFIRSLLPDNEGNLWAAKNDGLFRIRTTSFRNYSVEDGLMGPWVHSITEDEAGTIWTVSGGQLYRFHEPTGTFVNIKVPGQLYAMHVVSLSDNRMLVTGRNGALRLRENGLFSKLPSTNYVNAVAEGKSGEVWIGHRSGLSVYDEGQLKRITVVEGAKSELVEDVRVDSTGSVFVSVYDEGVFQKTDEGWLNLSDESLSRTYTIDSLYVDETDMLWAISRGNELLFFEDGKWQSSPSITGSYPQGLRSLWSDGRGGLWIPTYRGVYQVERNFALGNTSKNKARKLAFFAGDGLGSSSTTNSSTGILADRAGKLWVATQAGLSVANLEQIDSASFVSNARPILEEVILDQTESLEPVDVKSGLSLSPDNQLIELRYTATGLGDPRQAAFRYRLKNFQQPWVDVGDLRHVFLPKPPPGNYFFELQARNSHGIWGDTTLQLPIAVQPRWLDTVYARLFLSSGLMLLVALVFFWRQKRIVRKQRSMEEFSRRMIRAQEEERRSVAEELHDTIGQELIVLKAQIDMAKHSDPPATGNDLLSGFSQSLSKSIQLVKELSRGLRPALLEQTGLHSVLKTMIHEVSSAASIPIEFSSTDEVDSLGEEEQIGVFRIIQELLNNIVHHSDASEAKIEILRGEDGFSFEVSDDGRGFDPSENEHGTHGSGLASIARRLSLLSGTLEIKSEKGNGTRITFQLPSSH
ncbi:MAG: ATP-binding protein [Verrucomicrobiota bacterium]